MKYVLLTFLPCSCMESDEHWAARCVTAGGHVFARSVYKSTLHLCLTADGRVIELTEYR